MECLVCLPLGARTRSLARPCWRLLPCLSPPCSSTAPAPLRPRGPHRRLPRGGRSLCARACPAHGPRPRRTSTIFRGRRMRPAAPSGHPVRLQSGPFDSLDPCDSGTIFVFAGESLQHRESTLLPPPCTSLSRLKTGVEAAQFSKDWRFYTPRPLLASPAAVLCARRPLENAARTFSVLCDAGCTDRAARWTRRNRNFAPAALLLIPAFPALSLALDSRTLPFPGVCRTGGRRHGHLWTLERRARSLRPIFRARGDKIARRAPGSVPGGVKTAGTGCIHAYRWRRTGAAAVGAREHRRMFSLSSR